MNDHHLTSIYNYRRLSERIATAGQPTEAQLADVAAAGFEVVINLAVANSPEALPNERAVVESLGMIYEHIPVIWQQPTHENLLTFFDAMGWHEHRHLFIHCIANMRVSAFMVLYRVLQLGWPLEDALPDLHALWTPNATWQAFIDGELAR